MVDVQYEQLMILYRQRSVFKGTLLVTRELERVGDTGVRETRSGLENYTVLV